MAKAGRIATFAVMASVMVAGCGESLTGADNLSPEESLEIFNELFNAMFAGVNQSPVSLRAPDALQRMVLPATETFTTTSNCALGGTVTQSFTVEDNLDENGDGTFTFNAIQTPNDCGVSTSSGEYEVNGAPDLTWGGTLQFDDGEPVGDFTWTFNGGYDFTGSKDGSCDVDLTYVVNFQTLNGSVTGTMCGNQFDQTF